MGKKRIYDTSFRPMSPHVISMASGQGLGDILRDATDTATNYLGVRHEKKVNADIAQLQHFAKFGNNREIAEEREGQVKAFNDLIKVTDDKSPKNQQKIAAHVFGKGVDPIIEETDANVQKKNFINLVGEYNVNNTLPISQELKNTILNNYTKAINQQRQERIWGRQESEWKSEEVFNEGTSGKNKPVDGIVLGAVASSPEIQKLLGLKGEELNYKNVDEFAADLIKRGIPQETVKKIIEGVTPETDYQEALRVVADMKKKGITPSSEILAQVKALEAANIQARNNAINHQKDLIKVYTDQLNMFLKPPTKTRSSRPSKKKEISTLGNRSLRIFGKEQQKRVTPPGVRFLPGTDAHTTEKYIEEMRAAGYKPDKIAWIIEQGIHNGAIGGQFRNPHSFRENEVLMRLAAEYDQRTSNNNVGNVSGGSGNQDALTNSQIKILRENIVRAQGKIDMLNLPTKEKLTNKEVKRVLGLLRNRPSNPNQTSQVAHKIHTGKSVRDDIGKGARNENMSTGDPVIKAQESLHSDNKAQADSNVDEGTDSPGKNYTRSELLGGYSQVPSAPVIPPEVRLTEAETRRRNAPIPRFVRGVTNPNNLSDLTNTLNDVRNRGVQGFTAGVGAVNRAAEFFTDPFIDGYNALIGNDGVNPFGIAADNAERISKQKLMDRGYTEEQATNTLFIQQVLAPGAGLLKLADKGPKKVDKIMQEVIDRRAKDAEEAKKIAVREARNRERIIPEKPPIHLGGNTMAPEKRRTIEIYIEKFKSAEGRSPTVAEVKAAFGIN